MGFETPLALLALVAAGLPIVAHLLRRQDLPRRKLPTIALLLRAEAASKQRVRIVDLLLLIVRVLFVAAIALAIAGPFLRVTLAYGDGSVATVAIVVDDSMSMGGRGDPTLLARAIERASDVIESLPEGSEVALVYAGSPARTAVPRTDQLDRALRALSDAPVVSARGTDLAAAIGLAEHELAGARHGERRLLVLSDFAAHASPSELEVPSGVDASFERIGPRAAPRNAAIVDARATPDPTARGTVSVAVELRAQGMEGDQLDVVLRRGTEEVARERTTIHRGGARATLHAPAGSADPGLIAAIDLDDAVAMDDERGLLLRPSPGARVLVVASMPGPRTDGARFLSRAIDLAPEEGGALTRRRVDAETLATMELGEVDVVVLANVPAPAERVAARLRAFVERGGGLVIAPGESFDPRAYAARFGEVLPARPSAAVAIEVGGPHAAPGSDLVPAGSSGLDAAHTARRITLEGAQDAPLRFADGSAALAIGRYGDGKTAILATTLDDAWTDFPYRPGYLPTVVALLRRLAPRGSSAPVARTPGAPVSIEAPAGAVRMRVLTPGGEVVEYGEDDLDEPVELEETHTPGIYRVELATRDRELYPEPRLAFVLAPPPEESDLSPGDLPRGTSADARAGSTTVPRPLAPWLFLLAGLLALAEAALRVRAAHVARAPRLA